MNFLMRRACAALFVFSPLFVALPASACPEATPPLHLSMESPTKANGPQVGTGEYSYRFVVRDPQNVERPYRNGRYQVLLKGEATFPDGTRSYRGKTDAKGRTATFRMAAAQPESAWEVQPITGQGELGESFRLTSSECSYDLSGHPYMLDGELGPIFCGQALPGGNTARYMMPLVTNVRIYSSVEPNECRFLQKRINPVIAKSSPAARIAGLQQLLRDRKLANYSGFLQDKIDAQILRHGNLLQIMQLLDQRLAAYDGNPEERWTVYNSLGYDLVSQNPARHLAYATQLLDESLRLKQNLFNLDSMAWALYQAGRNDEALDMMNRVMGLYQTRCTESEKASYPEALAHRGMILWTQGKRTEALDDWAKADLSTQGGNWANFIPPWKDVSPLISERVTSLKAEGYKQAVCTEVVEEGAN